MVSPFDEVRESVRRYCEANHDFSFDPEQPIVRLHEPTFGADEISAALECMLTTQVTMGPKVKGFEREFAGHFGWSDGIMVNSGSSANLLALATLSNPAFADRLKRGDEVIVPALSWSTTVWPVVQMGLIPVMVDLDPATLNIDPAQIESAIGPRTRAVMIVPVYGNPCDMDAITDICERHGLILIEDCCEALGATYDQRPVGQFGAVGTFSFYYSHHMTTLEGGICVTNDPEFAELGRILRAHGWIRETENRQSWIDKYPDIDPRFLFVNTGFNLRATELQGAMGSVQLPKLAGFVETRRSNAAWFRRELDKFERVLEFQDETPKGHHSWFGFPIRIRPNADFTVADICTHLNRANIETRPIIAGNIARQPAMKTIEHRVYGDLPHADHVMRNGFAFGNHQAIDEAARAYIVDHISSFMAERQIGAA
ncbi:DegT/DnrJ/EryC1/StrS family aminotransferase [Thalassobaculum sp.]|uniref:DegT/DnrJ/EryC1/StrS family aminotransferase n=1 Tax=Thalassobaculum sp. TaxID=2022740 RepID=UPI0032F04F8D